MFPVKPDKGVGERKQETKQDGLWITDHWPRPVISDYFQFSEKNIKMFPIDYETSSCFDICTHLQNRHKQDNEHTH